MGYVTILEADNYFQTKLHEEAWSIASARDRLAAIEEATRCIDALNLKGYKATVATLLLADPDATLAEIRVAEAAQALEFPRGADTAVPETIQWACCEILYELLDGFDPNIEVENMSMNSHGIGSVRASYNRAQNPQEHLMNGIPSIIAWKYLKPFLRDDNSMRLDRIS